MTERLAARDIGLRYGQRHALCGVSLSLRAGELALLTGPNGSGKTSLLEVLLGSRRPERGEVHLDGQPLRRTPARLRARLLTLVPQTVDLRFDFTVENVVEMGRSAWLDAFASLGAEDRLAVHEALAMADISALRHRSLHELSAGERQRVHLARALAQRPEVLLLDEPTACLDPAHARALVGTLRDFADRGGSVLMTLHDLALATNQADRVLLMDHGRLISDQPTGSKPRLDLSSLGRSRSRSSRVAKAREKPARPAPTVRGSLESQDFGARAQASRECGNWRAQRKPASKTALVEASAASRPPRVILVLGGARSGKSRQAAELALSLAAEPVYLATSRVSADDPEHQRRIDRHRADRGSAWTTIEEAKLLSRHALEGRVVVVDCLTLWLANWFADERKSSAPPELAFERTLENAKAELDRTLARDATFILVSNEIGQGVHAMTEIGRQFTDLQGFLNQHAAARADTVVLMVAGLPQPIKGRLPPS